MVSFYLFCPHYMKNRVPVLCNIILFVLQTAKSCRQRLRPRDSQFPVGDSLEYHVSRQDMKLFRTLLVLVLSFLIMWSPIFIINFLILARNFLGHLYVSSTMFFWVVTFTLANSALNPILYSLCQFKNGWRRLCCGSVVAPLRKGPCGDGGTQGIQPWLFYQIEDSNLHEARRTLSTPLVTFDNIKIPLM